MIANTLEEFVEVVRSMKEEFERLDGDVTCEFSTNDSNLVEKHEIIHKNHPVGGMWAMYVCDVCVDNHPEAPLHVIIYNDNADLD
jgi:hypothetical protein